MQPNDDWQNQVVEVSSQRAYTAEKASRSRQSYDADGRPSPVLIEATSKQWKGLMLFGWLLCFGSFFVTVATAGSAVQMLFLGGAGLGLLIAVYAHCMAWWHHG